jgi:hypothetical protein
MTDGAKCSINTVVLPSQGMVGTELTKENLSIPEYLYIMQRLPTQMALLRSKKEI